MEVFNENELKSEQLRIEAQLKTLNAFNSSRESELLDDSQANLLVIQAGILYSYNEVLIARMKDLGIY